MPNASTGICARFFLAADGCPPPILGWFGFGLAGLGEFRGTDYLGQRSLTRPSPGGRRMVSLNAFRKFKLAPNRGEDATPLGLWSIGDRCWAEKWNPFGIQAWNFRRALGLGHLCLISISSQILQAKIKQNQSSQSSKTTPKQRRQCTHGNRI